MKKLFFILVFFLTFLIPQVSADNHTSSCDKRFLTLVNPVRSRELWFDKSLKPFQDQYSIISENNLSATWLLQYDVFDDYQLIEEIKKNNQKQELGVFLEVSQKLADKARVIYPYDAAWFNPRAIFLSGYSQTDRKKMIDTLMDTYKKYFKEYPKSVGAWWIDSFSFNYLKERYQIKSALIVADQLLTDNYGVWGQWWGVPYYPSKANILTPASTLINKQDVVIIQWAQRDLDIAHTKESSASLYSLQANDYIFQGKDISYFKNLVKNYLDCQNPLGQVTVGLETGIESVGSIGEYRNQLKFLKNYPNLQSVTMSQFANYFSEIFPVLPPKFTLRSSSVWELTGSYRKNLLLHDYIEYDQDKSFKDYFLADNSTFLNRKLVDLKKSNQHFYFPFYIILFVLSGVVCFLKRKLIFWVSWVLFSISCFGLLLRSDIQYGWKVFYGPVFDNINFFPLVILSVYFVIILSLVKNDSINKYIIKNKYLFYTLLPLSFGIDFLISRLRFSYISDMYYIGLSIDTLRFAGVVFAKPFKFFFADIDLPAYQAAALLRLNFDKIWQNSILTFIIYPLAHIFLAVLLSILLNKIPQKYQILIITILSILLIGHIMTILTANPRVVVEVMD